MEIYLLRHGIAEDGRPGSRDSERALTAEGREKLKRVLKRARAAGVGPTLILTSPYKRARQTAEVAAEVLECAAEPVESAALVPNASPHEVWQEIRNHKDEPSLLLASHEPLLSSAVALLLGVPSLQVDMKKAALARVDCGRFGPEPRGLLKWLLTPATAGE